jgi:hypothetical protein
MPGMISSKEDKSSVLYEGRAASFAACIVRGMDTQAIRARLVEAVAQSGKSARAVSLAAGLGPGYIHSITKEGKDPTIDNLISVCEAVPVSFLYVVFGIDAPPEDIEILQALQENPDTRQGIISILRARKA